jgi:hypothetical protein
MHYNEAPDVEQKITQRLGTLGLVVDGEIAGKRRPKIRVKGRSYKHTAASGSSATKPKVIDSRRALGGTQTRSSRGWRFTRPAVR